MSVSKIITLTVVGIIAIFAISMFSMYISYNNQEVALRKQAEAKKGEVEAVYDQMWKILQQKAQVTDQYKDAFKDIYPKLIEGRYSKGDGSLMKWIKESNPDFDASMYKDLMKSIEIQRTYFTNTQKQMLDIIREHETLVSTMPGKWFISDVSKIDYTVISSSRAKDTMKTGVDDDVDLFKKQ